MKKKVLFVLICLLALKSVGFTLDLETGVTFMLNKPIDTTFGGTFMLERSSDTIFGGGLNLGVSGNYNKIIGYGVYMNIIYAYYTDDRFGGVSFFINDTLIGILLKVVENDNFSLPISIGPYFYYTIGWGKIHLHDNIEMPYWMGFDIGVGGNITAKIKISETLKLYARLQVAYTILCGREIWITPCIGVGFKY